MDRLEQLILQSRLLTSDQLTAVKRDAESRQQRLAQTIVEMGVVDDRRFAEWMAQVSGARLIDGLPQAAIAALERRIPRSIAREYSIVPVAIEGDTITVATIDALDDNLMDILRTATGMGVRFVVARHAPLSAMVAMYYPEDDADMTLLPPVEEEELGNATRYIPPPTPPGEDTNPVRNESQLDRIERKLDEIAAMLAEMNFDREE